MGIKERKAKEKEELKGLILQAALELLERDGLAGLSIRKIAERIEYAPATLYLYYRDKDQLLFELHNVGFDRFFDKLRECEQGATARDRMVLMGEKYLEFGMTNMQLYNLMFVEREPIKEENLAHFDGWAQGYDSLYYVSEAIRQCQAEGSMRPGPVEPVTILIWSQVHGLVTLYNSERLEMIPEAKRLPILRLALHHFQNALFTEQAQVPLPDLGPLSPMPSPASLAALAATRKSSLSSPAIPKS